MKGGPKQPYAIGLKSEEPFALTGIRENWKRPAATNAFFSAQLVFVSVVFSTRGQRLRPSEETRCSPAGSLFWPVRKRLIHARKRGMVCGWKMQKSEVN